MIRIARRTFKTFTYGVALIVGAVLVFFGFQSRSGEVVRDASPFLGETAEADHINSGDSNPWGGGGDSQPRFSGDGFGDGGGDDGP